MSTREHPVPGSDPSTQPNAQPNAEPDAGDDPGGRYGRRALVALGLVVVLLGAVVGWLWWTDRQYGEADAAGQVALVVAKERATEVLSYDYRSVDQDLRRARSGLTGRFLEQFDRGTATVAPAARERRAIVAARVTEAAIVDQHPDRVVVLLFVSQNSQTAQSPDVQLSNVRVQATMARAGDNWLISDFTWV